jgi:hypothetical protein
MWRVLWVVVLVTIGTGNMLAQIDAGRVTGTVTDQSGAVVNGAKITLTNNDTGVSATKITADGIYSLSGGAARNLYVED